LPEVNKGDSLPAKTPKTPKFASVKEEGVDEVKVIKKKRKDIMVEDLIKAD